MQKTPCITLILLLHLVVTACAIPCDWFKYQSGNRCISCPKCPRGQEITENCNNNGRSGPLCQPCIKGQTFSNTWSRECSLCQTECPPGKNRLKECTLTNDIVCCSPGHFVDSNNNCKKISTATVGTTTTTNNDKTSTTSIMVRTGWKHTKFLSTTQKSGTTPTVATKKQESSIPQKYSQTTKQFATSTSLPLTHHTSGVNTPLQVLGTQSEDDKKENEATVTWIIVASVVSCLLFIAIVIFLIWRFTCLASKIKLMPSRRVRRSREVVSGEDEKLFEVHVGRQTFPPERVPIVNARPIEPDFPTRSSTTEDGQIQEDGTSTCTDGETDQNDENEYKCVDGTALALKDSSLPLMTPVTTSAAAENTLQEVVTTTPAPSPPALHVSVNAAGVTKVTEMPRPLEGINVTALQHFKPSDPQSSGKLAIAKENINLACMKDLDNQIYDLPREESEASTGGEFVVGNQSSTNKGHAPIYQPNRDEIPNDQPGKNMIDSNETSTSLKPANRSVPRCPHRPINRTHCRTQNCRECCPQDSDLFSIIFLRFCLQVEVCAKLNTTNNKSWKNLLTLMRQDKMIEQFSNNGEQNPALSTINKLLSLEPKLTFGVFKSMMNEIERRDVVYAIENHHFNCDTCRRNMFDEPKLCVCQLA